MSDTDRCSREELDRVIEWLLEVQNEPREKLKDEDAAYDQIMWFYKVYAYKIPDYIYTDDFLTAWNEYIEKYESYDCQLMVLYYQASDKLFSPC